MRRQKLDYHSGNSVHDLFCRLPKATIQRLGREVMKQAPLHGLTYVDDNGKTETITLTLRPRLIREKMRNALARTLRILDGAFQKIAKLYFQNPSLAELFPFSAREEDWISMMRHPSYQPGRVVSRWDANTTFDWEDQKEGFSFFEVNGVGVGGLWYGPSCAEITLKVIAPELRKLDSRFRPFANQDMRRLLLDVILAQRKKMGRTRGHIAFAMEKASGSNFVEFERLAKFFTQRGHPSLVCEPTDFHIKGEDLFVRGKKIDALYRDTTLSEICLFEEKGKEVAPLRLAFKRGQVISSLEGEFDHKSAFEVFTHPEFLGAFTSQERALFKRHILWTRLLREIKTPDPKGKIVDLIPYIRKYQSQLVLKPNRLYGGKGVVFGNEVNRSEWDKKIHTALGEPGEWVIQLRGKFRTKRFFRPDEKGVREKELYVVSGFFATDKGMGIVGRMSERKVVNVARRGGLTPILLVK